jgi:hypothetical protein
MPCSPAVAIAAVSAVSASVFSPVVLQLDMLVPVHFHHHVSQSQYCMHCSNSLDGWECGQCGGVADFIGGSVCATSPPVGAPVGTSAADSCYLGVVDKSYVHCVPHYVAPLQAGWLGEASQDVCSGKGDHEDADLRVCLGGFPLPKPSINILLDVLVPCIVAPAASEEQRLQRAKADAAPFCFLAEGYERPLVVSNVCLTDEECKASLNDFTRVRLRTEFSHIKEVDRKMHSTAILAIDTTPHSALFSCPPL